MKVVIFKFQNTFKAVIYNISKISQDRAELMVAENFHALGILNKLKPEDFMDYFSVLSAASKCIKPQLHAVISSNVKEKITKENLTTIAQQWLQKMGYSDQPYLIFYHYDIAKKHVHIVTSRVNRLGLAISDSFNAIRAKEHLYEILGIDTKKNAFIDFQLALRYKFKNRMELFMLLFAMEYITKIKGDKLLLIRYGKVQYEVALEKIYAKISDVNYSSQRAKQIKEILAFYQANFDISLNKNIYYRSFSSSVSPLIFKAEFLTRLKENHNLQLIFYGTSRKLPSNYCLIDHQSKTIFDGNEMLSVGEFINGVKNNRGTTSLTQSEHEFLHNLNSISQEQKMETIADFRIQIDDTPEEQPIKKRKKLNATSSN